MKQFHCKACDHVQSGKDCDEMTCSSCEACDWTPIKPDYRAMNADQYNDFVFAPCEDMAEARRRVADAAIDLSESARGWGMLTLTNARAQLVRAIELIDAMTPEKGTAPNV